MGPFKQVRLDTKQKQVEMARMLQISQGQYSKLENGKVNNFELSFVTRLVSLGVVDLLVEYVLWKNRLEK